MLKYDILVMGSGGSGMRAALEAGRQGELSVALMTKTFPTRSATGMAQGGINGVLKNRDPEDTIDKHIFDTIKGSDFLADQDAVEFFCQRMPACINELDYLGVPFSRDEQGRIAQRPFGGQSSPRTCYAADKTGHVLLHAVYEQCLRHNVNILSDWQLLDLVVDNGEICGVVVLNIKTGEIAPVMARAVVIATGGASRMYWLRTTNPYTSTGDGMAACFRAGVPLKDMEMIQFHPTGLAGTGILMSEASRGEGGYLLNNRGGRFMQRYAPEKMELATRDLVSQAIEKEIQAGRGFGTGIHAYVNLDIRHLGRDKILDRLPGIRDLAITFEHVDPIDAPIPIRPTCHYTMGGVDVVDYHTGATKVNGLFACGEAACVSIHGANRLGGNSLAEAFLFGKVAGEGAAAAAQQREFAGERLLDAAAQAWQARFKAVVSREDGTPVTVIRQKLAEIMWFNVGIFRQHEAMAEALRVVDELRAEYQQCAVGDDSLVCNTAFVNYVELGNMLDVAKAVVLGALHRTESRGCHRREDFPRRDDRDFLKHSLVTLQGSEYKLSYRPVTITRYQPAERRY